MELKLTLREIEMIIGALSVWSINEGEILDLMNKIKKQLKEKK